MSTLNVTVELDVDCFYARSPVVPAQTQGDPDDCYPAEGGEITSLRVRIGGIDITGVLDRRAIGAIEDAIQAEHELHGRPDPGPDPDALYAELMEGAL